MLAVLLGSPIEPWLGNKTGPVSGPELFALRERVYRDYLKLPMEF